MIIQIYAFVKTGILAGGLTPSNLEKANHAVHSWSVNGNESTNMPVSKAEKDAGQMKELVAVIPNRNYFQAEEKV